MNPLVLGVISALVAHNMEAVKAMMFVLARESPKQAEQVKDALERGLLQMQGIIPDGKSCPHCGHMPPCDDAFPQTVNPECPIYGWA